MNCASLIVGISIAGAMCSGTLGDVLVSNLAEPERDYNSIDANLWAAQSFETDANAYTLTSITAIAGGDTGAFAFAELRSSDVNGHMDTSPGGLLTTFTLPDLSGPRSPQVFWPDSAVVLAPATRYYFLFGALGPGQVEWSYAEGNGQVGPGALSQFEYTFDGGQTWGTFGIKNPFHIEVEVAPVVACYPDCDTSTGAGVLDIFDFLCFQNLFDAGDPYACDCDTSTGAGVCDIFDFLCFQNAYDTGCP